MTSPITDFIEARLRDQQAAAEAVNPDDVLYRLWCAALDAIAVKDEGGSEDEYNDRREFALAMAKETLAIGDPARVLREVAAKRALLEHHGDQHECTNWEFASAYPYVGCSVLRELAAVYSDHPDYNTEWGTT